MMKNDSYFSAILRLHRGIEAVSHTTLRDNVAVQVHRAATRLTLTSHSSRIALYSSTSTPPPFNYCLLRFFNSNRLLFLVYLI